MSKLFWNDVVHGFGSHEITSVESFASDTGVVVSNRFRDFRGRRIDGRRFYAHGPAGVVDWQTTEDDAKREYEKLYRAMVAR